MVGKRKQVVRKMGGITLYGSAKSEKKFLKTMKKLARFP